MEGLKRKNKTLTFYWINDKINDRGGFMLNNKTVEELLELYSNIEIELKNRGVIRTSNLTGELAEYYALKYLKSWNNEMELILEPPSTKDFDIKDIKSNLSFSVKGIKGKNNKTSIFDRDNHKNELNPKKLFDYAVVVKFNYKYQIDQVYLLSWDVFLIHRNWHSTMKGWDLTITNNFKLDDKVIKLSPHSK